MKPFGLNLGAKLIFIKDILGTMKEMELRVVLDKWILIDFAKGKMILCF